MKKIFAIALKDILIRFSSPSEWLFFLILPILFTVILSSATGSVSDSRVHLPVVDEAQSTLSAQLISELEQSASVRISQEKLTQAQSNFTTRHNSAVLIIPADFTLASSKAGTLTLQMLQQPNNLDAMISQQAVSAAANRVSSLSDIATKSVETAAQIQPFASEADRDAYYASALSAAQTQLAEAPQRLQVSEGNTVDQVEYDPRANSSAGQLITWVFIPLIGLAGMFASERQQGTLRRILTTPTRKSTYLLGTILGQVVTALVQMALLLIFGIVFMHVNWGQSPAALIVLLIAAALAAAALGTMLGTLVKTEGQANGLSVMLGMSMALLGGCWYPLELFPSAVQTAVKVLPTTWAMQGMMDIVLRGGGLIAVLPETAVLLGFAALFFTIGVLRFRYE
jgi:ABC-2 type transport system permease protein